MKMFVSDLVSHRRPDDLPILELLLGILAAFILSAATQFDFPQLNLTLERRMIGLAPLMGVLTV